MRRIVTTCLCVAALALAAVAHAEPLDLKQVAAGAGWLGHVDFDALRESTVMHKLVHRHIEQHPEAAGHLKRIEALVGMNPHTDLHGATFYGPQIGKHTGVLILHAKLNKERVQALASPIPHRETTTHGDHAIQSWAHEHHGRKHTVASAWYGEDRIVVASGVDELRAALDVLDGKADGVGADAPLAGNVPPGTTVLFRAAGISNCECKEPLVKQIESFRFVAGEHDGQSFYRWRVATINADTAALLKEVSEGAQALLALHCIGDEAGKKLVSAAQIKLEDKTLTVLWSASADDVWTVVESHIKKLEEKMAKHREHHGHHAPHHPPRPEKPSAPEKSPEDDF